MITPEELAEIDLDVANLADPTYGAANFARRQGAEERLARRAPRLAAAYAEQQHRLVAAAKHLGCEPDVIVSCAETRTEEARTLAAAHEELLAKHGALFDAASKLTIAVRSGRGVTEALATLELVLDPEGEEVTGG